MVYSSSNYGLVGVHSILQQKKCKNEVYEFALFQYNQELDSLTGTTMQQLS